MKKFLYYCVWLILFGILVNFRKMCFYFYSENELFFNAIVGAGGMLIYMLSVYFYNKVNIFNQRQL